MTSDMKIALICIALLGLLVFLLGFLVSLLRGKEQRNYGAEVNLENLLYKAQRAHGNTTEYAPALAVIMLALAQAPQPLWVLWSMGVVTLCRYVHAMGLLLPATMDKPNPMRAIGALGTYVAGVALAIALLVQAVTL